MNNRTPKEKTAPDNSPEGWLLYDGSCGFCSRWVPFWSSTLQKRGFEIAPLQEEWVGKRLRLTEAQLLEDLRLLFQNGAVVRGADVYRYLMRRVWWAYPLYIVSCLPGFRELFNWCYRQFALNRFGFSRACRIQPPLPGQSSPKDALP